MIKYYTQESNLCEEKKIEKLYCGVRVVKRRVTFQNLSAGQHLREFF